jgi:hypothetical protein
VDLVDVVADLPSDAQAAQPVRQGEGGFEGKGFAMIEPITAGARRSANQGECGAGSALLRAEPQGRVRSRVCHHLLDRRGAVAPVFGAVGGVDVRARLIRSGGGHVLDGDVGL